MNTEPTVLNTLTTDELWEELCRRHIHCVFIFEKDVPGKKTDNNAANGLWWSGSIVSALGLVHYALIRFKGWIKHWDYEEDD